MRWVQGVAGVGEVFGHEEMVHSMIGSEVLGLDSLWKGAW